MLVFITSHNRLSISVTLSYLHSAVCHGRPLTTSGVLVCYYINYLYYNKSFYQARQYGKYTDKLHQQIERIVGSGSVTTSLAAREHHGKDESYHECLPADAVVMPTSVDHVSSIVKLCNEERVPVIPFGTGTGLEGGVGAVYVSIFPNLNN